MHRIIPKKIFLFGSSKGNDGLTIHLTTNPKAENWLVETIGSEDKVKSKLSKFQYFDLTVATDDELRALADDANWTLKYRELLRNGYYDDLKGHPDVA